MSSKEDWGRGTPSRMALRDDAFYGIAAVRLRAVERFILGGRIDKLLPHTGPKLAPAARNAVGPSMSSLAQSPCKSPLRR
jgi:hypothetical protein